MTSTCDKSTPVYFIVLNKKLKAVEIVKVYDILFVEDKGSEPKKVDLKPNCEIKVICLRKVGDLPKGVDRLERTLVNRTDQPVVYVD